MSAGTMRAILAAAALAVVGGAATDASADGCGCGVHGGYGGGYAGYGGYRGHDCSWPGYGRSGCYNGGPFAARYGRTHTYYPSWWGYHSAGWSQGYGCDALGARLGAPCSAYAQCGYRWHVGPPWASLVYDRRAYAWPSWTQVGDAGDDDAAAAPAPAVPLGPRAEAHEALFRGDAPAAEAKFRELVAADPTDAAAWIGVAHSCLSRVDYAGAATALDKAAALGAISPTQRLDIPATYAETKDFQRRFEAVRVRTRFQVLDTNARTVLAWLEAGTGETSESVAEAKYVLRDKPAAPCARVLAGLPPEPPSSAAVSAQESSPAAPETADVEAAKK